MPNLLKISNFLKIPACKVVSNKNLHRVAKFLERTILLGLLAGAIAFQVEAWEMFLSRDSSFKIKEENIQEGPTLTFCPRKGVEIVDVIIGILEPMTYEICKHTEQVNLTDGLNKITWFNKSVNVTKFKIQTQWANCVMLETDFDDITNVIRKWIEIDLKLSPHSNATEHNHENDSQTDNVEQQQNLTEIPKTWEGIDVYVTSKVVFSFDFNHQNSVKSNSSFLGKC